MEVSENIQAQLDEQNIHLKLKMVLWLKVKQQKPSEIDSKITVKKTYKWEKFLIKICT